MKNNAMFPYRRNGSKKRGKGGGGRRHRDGGGRRVPGSAAELLPMLQPTTKALAQMLAGHTKMSGQLVHARNVLAQANRMVEDRMADRLPPAAREEFFEQLARLKLTIADAEEAGLTQEPNAEVQVKPVHVVGADRLREVALRLATSEVAAAPPPTAPVAEPEPPAEAAEWQPAFPGAEEEGSDAPAPRAQPRLRLAVPEASPPGSDEASASTGGPRRERLRLRSVRHVAKSSEG